MVHGTWYSQCVGVAARAATALAERSPCFAAVVEGINSVLGLFPGRVFSILTLGRKQVS